MESNNLCVYCDNVYNPGDSKCNVCDAEIKKQITSLNIKKPAFEQRDKSKAGVTVKSENATVIARSVEASQSIESAKKSPPIIEKTSWSCSFCTFLNDANLVSCGACLSDRTDPPREPQKETHTSHPVDSDRGKESPVKKEVAGKPNVDKVEAQYQQQSIHDWQCLTCTYVNPILALRCSDCNQNNQIYRLCTRCHIYFLMNDVDKECLDCLAAGVAAKERGGNTGHKRKESIGDKFAKIIKSKKNKENWKCEDPCLAENKSKDQSCQICDRPRTSVLTMVPEAVATPTSAGSEGGKKPKKGKWKCEDPCLSENKSKHKYCQKCGEQRRSECGVTPGGDGPRLCTQCHTNVPTNGVDHECLDCLENGRYRGNMGYVSLGSGVDADVAVGGGAGNTGHRRKESLVQRIANMGKSKTKKETWKCEPPCSVENKSKLQKCQKCRRPRTIVAEVVVASNSCGSEAGDPPMSSANTNTGNDVIDAGMIYSDWEMSASGQ